MKPRILVISADFPPHAWPTGIRAGKLCRELARDYEVHVITTAAASNQIAGVTVHRVLPVSWVSTLVQTLPKWRLQHVGELLLWPLCWPDWTNVWALRAFRRARSLHQRLGFAAVVGFVLPFAGALAGLLLKQVEKVPLIANLDDSPTDPDFFYQYRTWWHYLAFRRFENDLPAAADAVVYVSQANLERVAKRIPEHRHRLHLIRYGADAAAFVSRSTDSGNAPSMVMKYIGNAGGWEYYRSQPYSTVRALLRKLLHPGLFEYAEHRSETQTPCLMGKAIHEVNRRNPETVGRIQLVAVGSTYAPEIVQEVLDTLEIRDVVTVLPQRSHAEALQEMMSADVLFHAMPITRSVEPGGRISAKTYEYLMTD
ncbi:MAG TPA: glycosyltransferase, partial [Candidatus Ozemobacteraceae bacterium]|nr:glycosyltransferase [Candidatus Ozemobacteraceae bacterium]